jgi:hypothetical protein
MEHIKKLNADASNEDIIKKLNEIIEKVNSKQDTYITPMPSAYDLNAIGKILKKPLNHGK